MKKSLAIVIISLACVSWYPGAAPAAADLEVIVQPQTIQIGGNYNGTQISVSGEAPSNADILIRVKGETENYKLKKKGRALGVLWMNLASVDISNVPNLFLLFLPENSVNTGRKGAAAWQERQP